jgi:hypothetical protein
MYSDDIQAQAPKSFGSESDKYEHILEIIF